MTDEPRRPSALTRTPRDVAATALRELGITLKAALIPITRHRPLPEPVPQPGRVPVVIVHGYMGHHEMLRPLAHRLLEEGWPEVTRLAYPSMFWSFERLVDYIAEETIKAEQRHGGPVDLIGHSLGAFAARAWIKLYDGAPHVRRFVSLGGPHGGTALHTIVPSPVRAAFSPSGPWVSRVGSGEEPVPTTVIRARYDHQVFPPSRARIHEAHEVIVDAWGHNGLLWSTEAHDAVIDALTEPDAQFDAEVAEQQR